MVPKTHNRNIPLHTCRRRTIPSQHTTHTDRRKHKQKIPRMGSLHKRPADEMAAGDSKLKTKSIKYTPQYEEPNPDGYGFGVHPMQEIQRFGKGRTIPNTIKWSKMLDLNFATNQSPFAIPYQSVRFWGDITQTAYINETKILYKRLTEQKLGHNMEQSNPNNRNFLHMQTKTIM